jgi:copper(I)-binding protein
MKAHALTESSKLIARSLAMFAVLASLALSARADDFKVGAIEISRPWARATPKGATVAGGYLKITNTGNEVDRLVGGSSPVAGRLEIHQMSMNNGVMQMRPVLGGLELKPGESLELKPGSYHIMLMDLKHPVVQKQPIKASLVFEKAGAVEVEFAVEPVGSTPAHVPSGAHRGH